MVVAVVVPAVKTGASTIKIRYISHILHNMIHYTLCHDRDSVTEWPSTSIIHCCHFNIISSGWSQVGDSCFSDTTS